jgi:ectoine hydroxylase
MTHTQVRRDSAAMTQQQRAQFDCDGYLIIPGALDTAEVAFYRAALDGVYADQQHRAAVAPGAAMHQLSAVASCPQAIGLIDHPATFPLVWSVLGWNVHVYHSHLDVHPPVSGSRPPRFEWHQDGGRQNRELETDPRPRLSVKVAYWLSDVSVPGRGNLIVVPGSHRTNWIDGPPRRDMPWPDPAGAVEVCVSPGDAVLFDRRLWHARSLNWSAVTRKAIFFGYTYRWIAIRDDLSALSRGRGLDQVSPIQRQLLGEVGGQDGDHSWGHYPGATPLHAHLKKVGLLDPGNPALRS